MDTHRSPRGTEGLGIVDQSAEDLSQGTLGTRDRNRLLGVGNHDSRPRFTRPQGVLIGLNNVSQQSSKVYGSGVFPGQFGVQTGGIGNIGNKSVEPLDVLLDDSQQFVTGWPVTDQIQGLYR